MNKKLYEGEPRNEGSKAVIHIAGEYKDAMQRCSRCNAILIDNRNAMAPVGHKARFFEVGGEVSKKGNGVFAGRVREPSIQCSELPAGSEAVADKS